MKKLNVGIIGIGDISGVYIRNLKKYGEDVQVFGCASRGIEKAKRKAEEYGIPRYYASGEELLQDSDIDILLNLTTPNVHYYYNKMALEAGKHVYCEKPLARTFAEGSELLEIAKKKGLMIGCAPDTFMGGRIQTYKDLIDKGSLGDVFGALITAVGHGNEWFHSRPEFYYDDGAGPLYDIGPYYLTAMGAIFGPVKRINAMSRRPQDFRRYETGERTGQEFPVSKNVDTHIIANLEYQCGVIASLIMSFDVWDSELPRMEIYGTKGTLSMPEPDPCDGPNLFGGKVLMRDRENYRWKSLPRNPEDLRKPWREVDVPFAHNSVSHAENSRGIGLVDMACAIREGRPFRTDAKMALHTLEVMEGIVRSAKTGQEVRMTTTFSIPEAMPKIHE